MASNNMLRLLSRINPVLRSTSLRQTIVRNDSIFTKYREPPNGFLFNRKPLKPGEKREWEDWQPIWYGGWSVAILVLVVGGYFRPNDDLLDWARKEAEIRIAEIEAAEASAGKN